MTLETQTASATDATSLCLQNAKTKYFKTLKRRPLAVAAFKTVILALFLLCGNMQMLQIFDDFALLVLCSCTGHARGNFRWSFIKQIQGIC